MTERITFWHQPIRAIATGAVVGREWLVRRAGEDTAVGLWQAAVAEGWADALEHQVIARLCAWRTTAPGGIWFVNLHPAGAARHLPTSLATWRRWAAALAPVTWELIETPGWTEATVWMLAELGPVALDDWGDAAETSSRLSRWPAAYVKVAAPLLRQAVHAAWMGQWIRVVQQFAGQRGGRIIAEGVETTDQVAVVRELGIPLAQGFAVGRPRPWRTVTVS